jgi:hypothetical protein
MGGEKGAPEERVRTATPREAQEELKAGGWLLERTVDRLEAMLTRLDCTMRGMRRWTIVLTVLTLFGWR